MTSKGMGSGTIVLILPLVARSAQALMVPGVVGARKSSAVTSASKYVRVTSRNEASGV